MWRRFTEPLPPTSIKNTRRLRSACSKRCGVERKVNDDGSAPSVRKTTGYAGSAAFGGHRLLFRVNESERIVEHACTGFAHHLHLNYLISKRISTQSIMSQLWVAPANESQI